MSFLLKNVSFHAHVPCNVLLSQYGKREAANVFYLGRVGINGATSLPLLSFLFSGVQNNYQEV